MKISHLALAATLTLAAVGASAQKAKAPGKAKAAGQAKKAAKAATAAPKYPIPAGIKTAQGYTYLVNKKGSGPKLAPGTYAVFHMGMYNYRDSLFQGTRQTGKPGEVQVTPPPYDNPLMEVLAQLSQGDSASLYISSDTLLKGSPPEQRPPFIPEGSYVRYSFFVEKVQSEEEHKAEAEKAAKARGAEQKAALVSFAQQKGWTTQETPSGLLYVVEKAGAQKAQPGDEVEVHYTGTTLDGNKFDSSVDRGQPFNFKVGQGMVIKGWDEGIPLFGTGGKGWLLIPSDLAYGDRGAGGAIGPNQPLVFQIEVLKVNGVGAPTEAPAAPLAEPTPEKKAKKEKKK